MNEKVIIDGTDVSECENLCRFEDGDCCDRQYEKYASCEGYDCTYKQLKRLQAENEAYKNSIIANHDRAIGKRLEEVLEENEELKQALEEIRDVLKTCGDCVNCSKCKYSKKCPDYQFGDLIEDIINEVIGDE